MSTSIDVDIVKSLIDPVSLIRKYLPLRRQGASHVTLCPFHKERTPSFNVNSEGWHCFGCGAKGDIIRFVQDYEQIEFRDAITRIREMAGGDIGATAAPVRRTAPTTSTSSDWRPSDWWKVPTKEAYIYTNERGAPVFKVERREEFSPSGKKHKHFPVFVPDNYGQWAVANKENPCHRVLYRLDKIIQEPELYLVEGEKDVESIERQGGVATTAPGGSNSKWLPEFTATLAGKDVILIPDNDEPGKKRAASIASEIRDQVARLTVVQLPETCKDISDFFDAGNSLYDLSNLVAEARIAMPDQPVSESYTPQGDPHNQLTPNDLGEYIMHEHVILSDMFGYVWEYNYRHWERITTKLLKCYATKLDSPKKTSEKRRNEATNYVLACSNRKQIQWRQIAPTDIPVYNGVVDLNTGDLRPHRKEDYLESVPPTKYLGKRDYGDWSDALHLYFGKDPDCEAKIAALQEFFGYCLMPHARYKKALVLYGDTDTGKSQIAYVISEVVGHQNTCSISVEDMDDPRKLTPIIGKMVNILTELTSKSVVADGGFKKLISTEEAIQVDPKYEQPILYKPIAKHIVVCNTLPRITDLSAATFNRMLLIQFNHKIPPEKMDRNIMDRLRRNIEGVLYWAIEGAKRLVKNSGEFTRIKESDAAMAEYRMRENGVHEFIEEMCDADSNLCVSTTDFRKKYNKWSDRAVDSKAMGAMLRSAGYEIKLGYPDPNRSKLRCIAGISWRPGVS